MLCSCRTTRKILYRYLGLENEKIPKDVTHVIVDDSVTNINEWAFCMRRRLVSVIMGDNVTTIQDNAFYKCHNLKHIRHSKTLQYIGRKAFFHCRSLEILILPSSIQLIGLEAFCRCESLRVLILPDQNNRFGDVGRRSLLLGHRIIHGTAIYKIAEAAAVEYEEQGGFDRYEESYLANEWLLHHMDESPFHKLCCNMSIDAIQINDFLSQNGIETASQLDRIYGMTPLHMISLNPFAPADVIAGTLLQAGIGNVFKRDNQGNIPLDYARQYNVTGLLKMIEALCLTRRPG